MSGDTDAVLSLIPGTDIFDISIGDDGDIVTDDFFDTSITYSLLGERRASSSQVPDSELRRGWIGNENKDFENGSLLWLMEQSRLTRSNLNTIESLARDALTWLVDDGFAVSINDIKASSKNGQVIIDIEIARSRSRVERRFFILWQNTGIR